MATYAIGDIQGCYQTFKKLLKKIQFDAQRDQLWLVGDLINRGADSLKTLKFIYKNQNSIHCVLGNHDLHFLAVEAGQRKASKKDSFKELLKSPLRPELVEWLNQQPLFYYDANINFAMSHAGLPCGWTIQQALQYSKEVSSVLSSDQRDQFFQLMYGDQPVIWQDSLQGMDRLRYITNALTRMRYCYADGSLDLNCKMAPGNQPEDLFPWFEVSAPGKDCNLVFGHWASLQGKCDLPHLFALDTGCVWGGKLTALRLEDKQFFRCSSIEK